MRKLIFAVCCIGLLSGCSQYDLDRKIITVDGQVYELRHVVGDTFKTYKIDSKELNKMQEALKSAGKR